MKKTKGFTLIELIIVMAILTILMAAIMQMFKPIRETYVDATLYENQRTVQNGVIQYISESVRYATDLGIYTKNNASDVTKAVDAFADAYIAANNIVNIPAGANPTTDPAKPYATNTKEAIQRYAEVIVIDNDTDYTFNNADWNGRILRRKFIEETVSVPNPSGGTMNVTKPKKVSNDAENYIKTEECRMALGASYYGDRNYTVAIKCGDPTKFDSSGSLKSGETWEADDGIALSVASYSKIQGSGASITEKGAYVETKGEVMCKNLAGASNHGIAKTGIFDISKFTSGSSTGSGTKVYIVYLNPGENGIEAVRAASGK